MEYIYLDNAATTKVDPRVNRAIEDYLEHCYGNPSSLHRMGRESSAAVEEARERVAELVGAGEHEIVFTSGGTEADNLAIKGVVGKNSGKHIITTSVEHPAVHNTCRYLEKQGYEVTYLPVDGHGMVREEDFIHAIREDTVLASIIYASNEIGTIEPIRELAAIAKENDVIFHTDAVQAVGKLEIDVKKIGIDLLSISGHKIHGPKGVGALYLADHVNIEPMMHGGGHENGIRSGTENVTCIIGLGVACEIEGREMDENVGKMKAMRDRLVNGIMDNVREVRLNGHPTKRLVNNANFSFKAVEGEALVLQLDGRGIGTSTGSACSSKELKPSRILTATGCEEVEAHSSLRLTLSRFNTMEEIDRTLEIIPDVVGYLRKMSPLWEE